MKLLEIENITQLLDSNEIHETDDEAGTKRAAVATILRRTNELTEALFILRATKEGDPWSGQMAFPGGHYETHDLSLRRTAERETFEEIGLDLDISARYLGKIADVQANPRGRDFNMVVSPFVYVLNDANPKMDLNFEVADVLWGSLNDMYMGDNVTSLRFGALGREEEFPGYSVGNQVVWGLTLRMLTHFFTLLDPEWRPNYE